MNHGLGAALAEQKMRGNKPTSIVLTFNVNVESDSISGGFNTTISVELEPSDLTNGCDLMKLVRERVEEQKSTIKAHLDLLMPLTTTTSGPYAMQQSMLQQDLLMNQHMRNAALSQQYAFQYANSTTTTGGLYGNGGVYSDSTSTNPFSNTTTSYSPQTESTGVINGFLRIMGIK